MKSTAQLIGISVGPGDPELITVKALRIMRECDVLFTPQARNSAQSVAKGIVEGFGIPEQCFRTITFEMERSRESLETRYQQVADLIIEEIESGKKVGFLTLGDALTFSTWIYTLEAVREKRPDLLIETIPGVTSYAALAACTQQPLGEQKQRVLILPCPDDMESLRQEIELHDLVVLMKIGRRFSELMDFLREMQIMDFCVLGRRVGMEGGECYEKLIDLPDIEKLGYFSTMLIRKK